MGRLSRPLNSDAVKAADDEFYAKHPELVKDGKRIPLSATDPSQADLRKEWAELYKKHGGQEEDDENKPPAKKPDDPREPCSKKCKPIASLKVVELMYTSDHALLKDDETDWKNEGALYPEPEWKPDKQHPVSHSMKEKVSLKLKIEVKPDDACPETGALEGTGPDGLKFKLDGVSYKPGINEFALTSDKELSGKVQKLDFLVSWTAKAESTQGGGQTKNEMFVTIDRPRDPGQAPHGVTFKRMEKAIELVAPMGTTNPQQIVHELMKKLPYYVLRANAAVPSKYSHPAYFNSEGGAWPIADYMKYYAECQAIVRFVRKIIKQLGAPGDGKMVYVYAKPAAPLVAEEDDETKSNPALWSYLGYALVDQKVTSADVGRRFPPSHTRMPDGSTSMGFNAYEACLKFTAKDGPEGKTGPEKTYYYPGGTGGSRQDNKDDVLKHSFFALVEIAFAWYPTDSDPNKVEGLKITKIVADYSPFH